MSDGHCLRHAFSLMTKLEADGKKVLYVQGNVTHPVTRKTFQHAWVELPKEKLVRDPTIEVEMAVKDYYNVFSPKNVVRMEPFLAAMLCSRELKFFTKTEISRMESHIKELDAKMAAKRRGGK